MQQKIELDFEIALPIDDHDFDYTRQTSTKGYLSSSQTEDNTEDTPRLPKIPISRDCYWDCNCYDEANEYSTGEFLEIPSIISPKVTLEINLNPAITNSPIKTESPFSQDFSAGFQIHPMEESTASLSLVLFNSAEPLSSTIPNTNTNTKKCCNCQKSRCLKLYCECFAAGGYCEGCNCVDCHNIATHENERQLAMKRIQTHNPIALKKRLSFCKQENTETITCNCSKSGCNKKYCDCYKNGSKCSSLCSCMNCQNNSPSKSLSSKKLLCKKTLDIAEPNKKIKI